MNTRDLEYFAELCTIKSFSQVAAHFGVTQPTITMALKRLERHYGVTLIDRDQSHAGISVTPAGQQLAARVQVIIQQLTAAEAELARAEAAKLQFGLPPIIGSVLFPRLAAQLLAAGLMTRLQPHEAGSDQLLADLRAGQLDLALLGSTAPLQVPGARVTPLAQVPFVLVMAPDHPLSKRTPLHFADLAAEPFVTLSEGFVHTQALTWLTRQSGVRPRSVYRTPDVTLLKQMVQARVGLALLAQIAITPSDALVTRRLSDPGQPVFHMQLVTSQTLAPSPTLTQLTTILTSTKEN
ncbi:LysR family transcriptional regulator [Lacticaseibacillus absianus]|uniref:LysR family transcriptional regulator n=1 Tax=Lacticaseibacillus absianus TaxID=2729623 RepID=UPI0015CD6E7C|nr:LysR family transcriptional regulator [Lacticaseibacillus absianus]